MFTQPCTTLDKSLFILTIVTSAFRASRRSSMLPGAAGPKLMRPAVEVATGPPPRRYKVTMLGAPGVGKSALTSQFLSSDHMNTYDNVGESRN